MRPGCGVLTGRAPSATSWPSSVVEAATRRCGWPPPGERGPALAGQPHAGGPGHPRGRVPRRGGRGTSARPGAPGPDWALDQLPDLLGAADDWTGFEARHPVVAEAWRRHPHVRLGRTARPLEALVPTIIEQKVTGKEAFAGFRALVLEYGEPAPGPAVGLRLQPTPATLGEHPVVGVARPAHRPGAIPRRRHRGPARRRAGADRRPRRAIRPRTSTARSAACPGLRGLDERRGAAACARRPRRRLLRRLPRSQGRRLGVGRTRDR